MSEIVRTIPVICLHDIRPNPGDDIYALEPSQLDELLSAITFTRLSDIRQSGDIHGSALLTFDDGYAHHVEYALPILTKHNVDAIFFLLPLMLGKTNIWDHRAKVIIDHLAVSGVRELVSAGQTIGSHGLTHQNVVKLSQQELFTELNESRQRLQALSSQDVTTYAYPYGDFNSAAVETVRDIYDYSFATDQGDPIWSSQDNCAIKRISVRGNQSIEAIVNKISLYGNM